MVRVGAGRAIRAAYGPVETYATMHGRSCARPPIGPTLGVMDQLAFVCPGQGSQSVGMGRVIAGTSPAAAAVFAAADDALGESLSELAWNGPAERLDMTEYAQPAILATSIAILAALRERWASAGLVAPTPAFIAGHSMGQYSALVIAYSLSLADAVRLVRQRGRLMQASGQGRDGAMAAIIGLDDARTPGLVKSASQHGTFVVANRNSPGQIVVSGERPAVEAGVGLAKDLGAKRAIVLPVSVAAHSPLMAEAADGLRTALADVTFSDPSAPLIANADAGTIDSAAACRAELIEHLTAGVDWVRAVERMSAAGVTTFVEIGPGRVVTGLIRRIAPDAEAIAADDPASADRLLDLAAPIPA
jgi:[acyl-carrier-protein] S-malonyltransferase